MFLFSSDYTHKNILIYIIFKSLQEFLAAHKAV